MWYEYKNETKKYFNFKNQIIIYWLFNIKNMSFSVIIQRKYFINCFLERYIETRFQQLV